ERAGPAGAVPQPGQAEAFLATLLEGEADPREDRHEAAHQAGRRKDAQRRVARVQIAAARDLIAGPQVRFEHLRDRHPHRAAGPGVSYHRADDIPFPQGVRRPDCDRFLAGPKPGLRENPLTHPALQGDVVQPEADHPLVQAQQRLAVELLDEPGAPRVARQGFAVLRHHLPVRLEADVLGRVVGGMALHRRISSSISRTARSIPTRAARATIEWPMLTSWISGIWTMRRTFL